MLDLAYVIIIFNCSLLKYSMDSAKLFLILKSFITCILDYFFLLYQQMHDIIYIPTVDILLQQVSVKKKLHQGVQCANVKTNCSWNL